MSKRNQKRTNHIVKEKPTNLVDICLLTAGMVEPTIFDKCLDAIHREAQTISSKIYVYRNGIPPETRDAYSSILSKYPATVSVSSENKGFPFGANHAIRMGNAPLVLFISDDIILHPGALQTLVRRMDDPEIGNCGLKLLFPEDSQDPGRPAGKVQHIGHGIDIRGEIVHPLIGWSPDNPKCCVSRDVVSVTGAVFMIRRHVFRGVGGFFEGFGMGYFEDVDMNMEIRKQGWRVFIDTDAIATHYTGATFVQRKVPVNMEKNKMILRARKANLFVHDSFWFW